MLHVELGVSFLQKGQYPEALKELLQAYRYDPKNPVILNNLALAYLMHNKLAESERYLREALALDPEYTESRNNLGRVLIEQGAYSQAVAELEVCLEDLTYPNADRCWTNLALAHFRDRRFANAEEASRKAVSLRDSNCTAHILYGRSLYEIEKFTEAIQALDKMVQKCMEPDLDEAKFYGALSFYRLGRSDEAMARLQNLVESYPTGRYTKEAQKLMTIMRQ